MAEPTVGANVARSLLAFAASRGASTRALTARSGVDLASLRDSDGRIPLSRYIALMRSGQELCNDPALALHFGEVLDPLEVSIGCMLVGFSRSIDDAFAQVNRYARLSVEVEGVGTGPRFQLRRSGGQLWIVDTRRNPNGFPELTEVTFASMVCSTRRSLGDSRLFGSLRVTHTEPAYGAEYERVFRIPVAFGASENALRVEESRLSRHRLPPPSRYASGVLKKHADRLLERLDGSASTRRRVEELLLPMLQAGGASVDSVAGELGVSRQTLFRRLKAEGVTFERVLDELRYALARHYLSSGGSSLRRIAGLVGYADAAAFSRAFKRWSGHSPSTYASRRPASSGPGSVATWSEDELEP